MTFKTKILTGLTALVLGLSCGGEEATTPGCTKDSDCKNNRVCNYETGMCEQAEENDIYISPKEDLQQNQEDVQETLEDIQETISEKDIPYIQDNVSPKDIIYQEEISPPDIQQPKDNVIEIIDHSTCLEILDCIANNECNSQSCVDYCKQDGDAIAKNEYNTLEQCVFDNCLFKFYKIYEENSLTEYACALENCWPKFENCYDFPIETGPFSCNDVLECQNNCCPGPAGCTTPEESECITDCNSNATPEGYILLLKIYGCGQDHNCFDSPDKNSCFTKYCTDEFKNCNEDK